MKKENQKSKKPLGVIRKGIFSTVLGVSLLAGAGLAGCDQNPDLKGKDGATWLAGTLDPQVSQGAVGDFYYDTDDFKIYQKEDGGWKVISVIKPAVSIDNDGYWVIDGTTTTVKAAASQVTINSDGYWELNGSATSVKAAATQVTVSDDGYWELNGSKTEYKVVGNDGHTPYIEGGYWYINGQNQHVKALAEDGKSAFDLAKEADPTLTTVGAWLESLKGANGYTPYIEGGYWYINGQNQHVKALAEDGKSAFDLAKEADPTLTTVSAWLESLKGADGESAYEVAKRLDNTIGTEAEWIASLKGETGSVWYTGEGVPTTSHRVGDYYLDSTSSDVYVQTSNGWDKAANIKGQKGQDALNIKSFRKVVDTDANKWGMVYYFELTMSDNSIVETEKAKEVLENHYYTATEKGDIEDLLTEGVKYIRLGADVELKDNLDEETSSRTLRLSNDLHIDLNGFTLKTNNRLIFTGANVSFTDGEVDITLDRSSLSAIQVQGGTRLKLNDVKFNANVGSGILALNSEVEITDSVVTAQIYAINTNAGSVDYYYPNIYVKDSVLSTVGGNNYDNTAILFNVKGNLVVENSEVYGDRQALIVRGGDALVKNSKVVLTGTWYEKQETEVAEYYYNKANTWGDGNKVPSAAIVLGNNSAAYQYAANLTVENSDIVIYNKMDLFNLYIMGNQTEEGAEYIGATFIVNNENLTFVDLMNTYYDMETVRETVKMNIQISNRETLDEIVKFVNYMTMMMNMPVENLISVLNPTLTQDIIIVEEEMTFEKLNVYMQANQFVAGVDSKYGVYATALSILVATEDEFITAIDFGPVKLLCDIDVTVSTYDAEMIEEFMQMGFVNTNGFNLNVTVDDSLDGPGGGGYEEPSTLNVVVSETYGEELGLAINEIQEKLYNKIENTNGGNVQYYTLAELKEKGIDVSNYYIRLATIENMTEFKGIAIDGTTQFIDGGDGISPIPVSIGQNVFVNEVPVYFDTETNGLYICSVILASEMMSVDQFFIIYGDNGQQSTQVSFNRNDDNTVLTAAPIGGENTITGGEDNYFYVEGNNTKKYIVLNYENNTNESKSALAVTKKVTRNKNNGNTEIIYGFTLTDAAVGDGTYTIGLYNKYGIDLTQPENVESYEVVMEYTAYIHGQGLLKLTLDYNAPESAEE